MKKRTIALLLAMLLVIGCGVGGTLAWLMDKTDTVTNTFTESDIEITLTETTGKDYQMIPGWMINKDPLVTVKADSEDCWVFLEVKESENLDDYIDYDIDPNNWTKLELSDYANDVYYCKVTDVTVDRKIKVLGYTDSSNNEFHPNGVMVKSDVTKEMMEAIDGDDVAGGTTETKPTLSFTAYAVQLWKDNNTEFTVNEAWAKAAAMNTENSGK